MEKQNTTFKRRWYLVYREEESAELNKRFISWYDSKMQDHHFEQVVRCYPSLHRPCICAEHYGNIDCVPMLSTVFFISSIDTTAVNRSWIDNYAVIVNDTSTEIDAREFNNLMRLCQGFPIAKYNVIIPTETAEGELDTTLMSFYKGVLGGLCVIEKEYYDEGSYQASLQERQPWEGLFREVAEVAKLEDASLSRCMVQRDFEGNGFIRSLSDKELSELKEARRYLYDQFLTD